MRGAEACRGTRRCPCASGRRRGAGTRRIMSEALNSDSTNRASFLLLTFVAASGRLSQSQVAGLRYSDQFAHGGDGVIAFFAADEPCGARSPMFSREEGSRFFQELASLRATRASPPSAWRSRPTPRRPRGPGPRRASSCTWRPSPPPSAEPDRKEAATDAIVRSFSRISRTTCSLNSSGYFVLVMNSSYSVAGRNSPQVQRIPLTPGQCHVQALQGPATSLPRAPPPSPRSWPPPSSSSPSGTNPDTNPGEKGSMKLIQRVSWCISGKQYYDGPFS